MRTYPHNSPQAAARVLALALLADGDLSPRELQILERLDAHRRLGLTRDELHAVLQTFCEDLLYTARLTWCNTCRVEVSAMHQMLDEIEDPRLQRLLLSLCMAAVVADERVTDDEASVIEVAAQRWGLTELLKNTDLDGGARDRDEPLSVPLHATNGSSAMASTCSRSKVVC